MNQAKFNPQETEDGSYTFYSEEFAEAFHSYRGAKQEAEIKYVVPTLIREKATKQKKICLLDVCYGLGYNSAAAISAIHSIAPQCQIELIALEIDPHVPRQAIAQKLLLQWQSPTPQILEELADKSLVKNDFLQAQLLLGDARKTIGEIAPQWQADAIFLDPFSPPKCPQLWTVEFIALVAKRLKSNGRLATYSCAAAVRAAFSAAGLKFCSIDTGKNFSPGTVASLEYKNILPLSQKEIEHLQTRAAVPYRDETLQKSPAEIRHRRQQEQQTSVLETSSQWRKRWMLSNI